MSGRAPPGPESSVQPEFERRAGGSRPTQPGTPPSGGIPNHIDDQLRARYGAVVWIEVYKLGSATGFLVGSDLVLTARHVAQAFRRCPDGVSFHFGYARKPDGALAETRVAKRWRIVFPASLDAADAATIAAGDDYALIRLSDVPGGLAPLRLEASPPQAPQEIAILHYPGGRSIERSIRDGVGHLVQTVNSACFTYTGYTEPGSSGAPVIAIPSMQVIGVHGGRLFSAAPAQPDDAETTEPEKEAVRVDRILGTLLQKAPDLFNTLQHQHQHQHQHQRPPPTPDLAIVPPPDRTPPMDARPLLRELLRELFTLVPRTDERLELVVRNQSTVVEGYVSQDDVLGKPPTAALKVTEVLECYGYENKDWLAARTLLETLRADDISENPKIQPHWQALWQALSAPLDNEQISEPDLDQPAPADFSSGQTPEPSLAERYPLPERKPPDQVLICAVEKIEEALTNSPPLHQALLREAGQAQGCTRKALAQHLCDQRQLDFSQGLVQFIAALESLGAKLPGNADAGTLRQHAIDVLGWLAIIAVHEDFDHETNTAVTQGWQQDGVSFRIPVTGGLWLEALVSRWMVRPARLLSTDMFAGNARRSNPDVQECLQVWEEPDASDPNRLDYSAGVEDIWRAVARSFGESVVPGMPVHDDIKTRLKIRMRRMRASEHKPRRLRLEVDLNSQRCPIRPDAFHEIQRQLPDLLLIALVPRTPGDDASADPGIFVISCNELTALLDEALAAISAIGRP